MRHNDLIQVFCLTHRANFPVLLSGSKIACEEGGSKHILSNHFPTEGNWLYCCNCRNFWLIAPEQFGMYVTQCPACGCGENARLYTCDQCNVTMVDFDDCTRHKSYNLLSWGMPQPSCPGCRSFPRSAPQLHECTVLRRKVASARAECVFCVETTATGNTETVSRYTDYLAVSEAKESIEQPKPILAATPNSEKDEPLANSRAPIALAAPSSNGLNNGNGHGNGYKRNGSPGRENGRERQGNNGLQTQRTQGAGHKNKANGRGDETRHHNKPDEQSRAWRELEAKHTTLDALLLEAEAKLREAEERNRQIEQREAELQRLAEEQERQAAEREIRLREQAEEQARAAAAQTVTLTQAKDNAEVSLEAGLEATLAIGLIGSQAPTAAELPPLADTQTQTGWPVGWPEGSTESQLSKDELDRQLEEEWARIEVEIKRAEAERKVRTSVGFQRTISPPNRPALRLEKIRDKTPTKPFPTAADEPLPEAVPTRTLTNVPTTPSTKLQSNRLENLEAKHERGKTALRTNTQTARFSLSPTLHESEVNAEVESAFGQVFGSALEPIQSRDKARRFNEQAELSAKSQELLTEFTSDSVTSQRNLLVGYLVITLLLLVMLFGLGSFAYYLINHSS